jgi:hypothetical protein
MVKRDDNLKDSFYLYIMRNSIGAGLKTKYAPDGDVPDRLAELLHELDGKSTEEQPADAKKSGNRRPARKR